MTRATHSSTPPPNSVCDTFSWRAVRQDVPRLCSGSASSASEPRQEGSSWSSSSCRSSRSGRSTDACCSCHRGRPTERRRPCRHPASGAFGRFARRPARSAGTPAAIPPGRRRACRATGDRSGRAARRGAARPAAPRRWGAAARRRPGGGAGRSAVDRAPFIGVDDAVPGPHRPGSSRARRVRAAPRLAMTSPHSTAGARRRRHAAAVGRDTDDEDMRCPPCRRPRRLARRPRDRASAAVRAAARAGVGGW